MPFLAGAGTMAASLAHLPVAESIDFAVRRRDVSDGCLEDHFGEAVVEFNVERWGSEGLYTS